MTDGPKTEVIARLWRLLGERREVIDKFADLAELVEKQPGLTAAEEEGFEQLEKAVANGLDENERLCLEALSILGQLEDEGEQQTESGNGKDIVDRG